MTWRSCIQVIHLTSTSELTIVEERGLLSRTAAGKESGNEWRKDGGRRKVISDNCEDLANMQVSQPNNVKIYNLSAGKSLPEVWTKEYRHVFYIFEENRFRNRLEETRTTRVFIQPWAK